MQRAQIHIDMSQYKQYYTVYKDKDWKMLPQIHQGVMNSWHILKTFLTEEEIVVYCNGCNTLSSKPQIKKIKAYHSKKKEASKEEGPVASNRKPQANQPLQEGKKNKKKKLRKPSSPRYRIPKIQKDAMENVFNIARILMEVKEKGAQRMQNPHFPKA
ncbi:hypothetical protein O181_132207 [Austropuccinia psidii MF-1]|uniref:Uncharacterized protein n=1 Tax=Austropuccinia psidii MF-1 TaxID=1389203 RepID=A0A9Q3QDR9_9BASI|nr:hypothetical protein [Austropuccinia psidii MF-1]